MDLLVVIFVVVIAMLRFVFPYINCRYHREAYCVLHSNDKNT